MRRFVGRTPVVLARRYLGLDRLATLVLQRDQFATPPGPTVTLALGERTCYRPGAWVLDTFERADGPLGASYATLTARPGFGALGLTGATVGPAALSGDVENLALCTAIRAPRDQWAQVTLSALGTTTDPGAYASVGVGLRWSGPTDPAGAGYLAAAYTQFSDGHPHVYLSRFRAGVVEADLVDLELPIPWAAGDTLRCEAEWNRLRLYRNGVCLADVVDPAPILTDGYVALEAWQEFATDAAAGADFVGGALRYEYLGAVLDMGDIQHVLGQPATFDVTVSNLAPMGGASRFAALLRHGLNTAPGTYDLDRGTVRVYSALAGGDAPLMVARGLIDAPAEVTEDRVRVNVRGRDAFLTPRVDPGTVAYLGAALPALAPVPSDPCAPYPPPTIDVGAAPVEPATTDPDDALGPEAPRETPGGGGGDWLLGTWWVVFDYRLQIPEHETAARYVGSTTVTQIPTVPQAAKGLTNRDYWRPSCRYTAGAGSMYPDPLPPGYLEGDEVYPATIQETWLYRGGDVPGAEIERCLYGGPPPSGFYRALGVWGQVMHEDAPPSPPLDDPLIGVKLARYDASGIRTSADLAALRPKDPSELGNPLPARIETVSEWALTGHGGISGNYVLSGALALNQFAGPELLRLENTTTGWAAWRSSIQAEVATFAVQTLTNQAQGLIADDIDGTHMGGSIPS